MSVSARAVLFADGLFMGIAMVSASLRRSNSNQDAHEKNADRTASLFQVMQLSSARCQHGAHKALTRSRSTDVGRMV
jgi:hypothetical protein